MKTYGCYIYVSSGSSHTLFRHIFSIICLRRNTKNNDNSIDDSSYTLRAIHITPLTRDSKGHEMTLRYWNKSFVWSSVVLTIAWRKAYFNTSKSFHAAFNVGQVGSCKQPLGLIFRSGNINKPYVNWNDNLVAIFEANFESNSSSKPSSLFFRSSQQKRTERDWRWSLMRP